jgi:hypothetical protein
MTRELPDRCRAIPLPCNREQDQQSTVASLLRVRANHEPIGLICGREGCSPVDVESLTIELKPAGLVARYFKCDFHGHALGHAFQRGQRELKGLFSGVVVRYLERLPPQAVER